MVLAASLSLTETTAIISSHHASIEYNSYKDFDFRNSYAAADSALEGIPFIPAPLTPGRDSARRRPDTPAAHRPPPRGPRSGRSKTPSSASKMRNTRPTPSVCASPTRTPTFEAVPPRRSGCWPAPTRTTRFPRPTSKRRPPTTRSRPTGWRSRSLRRPTPFPLRRRPRRSGPSTARARRPARPSTR